LVIKIHNKVIVIVVVIMIIKISIIIIINIIINNTKICDEEFKPSNKKLKVFRQ
jgi:hypothetical protein